MPEIVYYAAASLDGFIATPDGGVGWLAPFEASEDDYRYAAFYASIDGLLRGRQTCEQSLTFGRWPYAGKASWVFSHRRRGLADNVEASDRSSADIGSEMEVRGVRRVWLVARAAFAASFRADGLITECIASVMPVILGDGVVQVRYVRSQDAPTAGTAARRT